MARRKVTAPAKDAVVVEVLKKTRADADFYTLLGPFLARRDVVKAVGGPIWDDDGKVWSIATVSGAVVGFIGGVQTGDHIALSSGYVCPGTDAASVWAALLDGAIIKRVATVGPAELPHFKRAGFKVVRERGRFSVVEWAP